VEERQYQEVVDECVSLAAKYDIITHNSIEQLEEKRSKLEAELQKEQDRGDQHHQARNRLQDDLIKAKKNLAAQQAAVRATKEAVAEMQGQLEKAAQLTRAVEQQAQAFKQTCASWQRQLDTIQAAAADKEEGLRLLERQVAQLCSTAQPSQRQEVYPMEQLRAVQDATQAAATEHEREMAEAAAAHVARCQQLVEECKAQQMSVAAQAVADTSNLQQEAVRLRAALEQQQAHIRDLLGVRAQQVGPGPGGR
jgi:epidermal growth factor receptor substrate 15